jgi:multiple RNA-binding domain-containing protein 1
MSSRICVKNLGKNTVEKDLKAHFGSRGEITDVKIVKTAAGKSRQFGFIGFRSHEQAKDCQEYFNNTFLKSAKIGVEMAMKIGDPSLPGKHDKKAAQSKSDNARPAAPPVAAPKDKSKAASAPDSAKSEFMSVMKSRGKGQAWANDAFINTDPSSSRGPAVAGGGADGSDSESDTGAPVHR